MYWMQRPANPKGRGPEQHSGDKVEDSTPAGAVKALKQQLAPGSNTEYAAPGLFALNSCHPDYFKWSEENFKPQESAPPAAVAAAGQDADAVAMETDADGDATAQGVAAAPATSAAAAERQAAAAAAASGVHTPDQEMPLLSSPPASPRGRCCLL